jgi:hypothetical protein
VAIVPRKVGFRVGVVHIVEISVRVRVTEVKMVEPFASEPDTEPRSFHLRHMADKAEQ